MVGSCRARCPMVRPENIGDNRGRSRRQPGRHHRYRRSSKTVGLQPYKYVAHSSSRHDRVCQRMLRTSHGEDSPQYQHSSSSTHQSQLVTTIGSRQPRSSAVSGVEVASCFLLFSGSVVERSVEIKCPPSHRFNFLYLMRSSWRNLTPAAHSGNSNAPALSLIRRS